MTMQLVGWAIVHSLWQGGVIALVAAGLLALARHMQAHTRYAIGLAGLALMIALPILTALNSTRSRNNAPPSLLGSLAAESGRGIRAGVSPSLRAGALTTEASPSDGATPSPSVNPPSDPGTPAETLSPSLLTIDRFIVRYLETALPWLALAWVFGLLIASAQLIGGLGRTRRITRVGITPAASTLSARVAELSKRLGVSQAVRVLQSVSVDVPLVVGALRPVIVVPVSLMTGLTPVQIDMLLAHEIAHIRRYDFLVNLVQTVVETLLFYHPAVGWLSERVREERENCCDDIVVSICGGDTRGYTETLLALEEFRSEGFGLAAAATGGALLRRAHRLITGRSPHIELGPRWIAGVITIAAALFTGSEAMGGIESSFAPLPPAVSTSEDGDSTGKRDRVPDPSRAGPGSVLKSPTGGTLEERWRWADSQAQGLGTFWVGYLVGGDPSGKSHYYADDVPIRLDRSTTISGHMMLGDDISGMRFSGVPLAPIVGQHARGSTAIFVLFNDGLTGKRVQRVRVGTFSIPMYFDRRPVIWLDSANDKESIDLVRSLMPRARDANMRRDLVGAIGMHRTVGLVVPQLIALLQSRTESEGVRRESAEWLGRTNDTRSVVALSRAVRSDRSKGVRDEAIEAFEHMPAPSATDSLISFASTLADYDLRSTAIESLGHRDEPRALEYLTRVVRTAGHDRLRIDALEAIAEMPDGRGFQTVLNFARTDPDPDIRRKAVESIADSEPPARVLDVLAQLVRTDPNESVRREAIETIAEVHDARSVAILRDLANNANDLSLQIEAVESLGETVDPESALNILESIARNHPRGEVRKKALETLGDFHDEPRAVQILVNVARNDRDTVLRPAAIEALGETHGEVSERALASLTGVGEPLDIRLNALKVYAEQAEPRRALAFLKTLIENEKNSDVRLHAVNALEELNDDIGIPWLRELARSSRDPMVKARAQHLLDDR